jgi:hypothetical protein
MWSRWRLGRLRRRGSGSDEASWLGGGWLSVAVGDLAGDDGGSVSVGVLHESFSAAGEVSGGCYWAVLEFVEVDDVEVAFEADADSSAVW